jgi:hypothetical protein
LRLKLPNAADMDFPVEDLPAVAVSASQRKRNYRGAVVLLNSQIKSTRFKVRDTRSRAKKYYFSPILKPKFKKFDFNE